MPMSEEERRALPGNGAQYRPEGVERLMDSPLRGKRIAFLGSSVTRGSGGCGVSFVDFLATRHGFYYEKEAVDGTTLADLNETSYIRRMHAHFSPESKWDLFVCQLSTNDARKNVPLGVVDAERDIQKYDTQTILGAMEYIIAYVRETWRCPVMFYTNPRYDNAAYANMVEGLLQLQRKWGIGVIDLWRHEAINNISDAQRSLYMCDSVHPTRAGYMELWLPVMEQMLIDYWRKAEEHIH